MLSELSKSTIWEVNVEFRSFHLVKNKGVLTSSIIKEIQKMLEHTSGIPCEGARNKFLKALVYTAIFCNFALGSNDNYLKMTNN